ncbi:MAG: CapA family protein [Candidatus Pacebacteria bacterium]|jgi:poly-gamma-glutamate synthesis protein (capsule biosynthesis protein)|nr:CapA family protein [Candidatus Paceibacterota bacterium]
MKITKIGVWVGVVLAAAFGVAGYWGYLRWGRADLREVRPSVVVSDPTPIAAAVESGTTTVVGSENVPPAAANAPVKIIAFGDLLLDRYIKLLIDRNDANYPLEKMKDVVAGNDLVLANLEGSFTDFSPRKLDPNNTSFTFDPKLVSTLTDNGFNIVNLANNHVRDFGKQGFAQSQAYLDKAGIAHFGDYYNEEPALVKEINGQKVAFIAYNEFGDASIGETAAKVNAASSTADYVIVYTHWGVEYQNNFSIDQQRKAQKLIDAGANVVLGSHPHVTQPIEIYRNKPIFYSLGNFLFDQIFSFDVRHGLGVKLTIGKDKVAFDLYPTEMKDFRVSLADSETKTAILKKIAAGSVCDESIKEGIAQGRFVLER